MREEKIFECNECEFRFPTDEYNTSSRYGIKEDNDPMSYTKCSICDSTAQEV